MDRALFLEDEIGRRMRCSPETTQSTTSPLKARSVVDAACRASRSVRAPYDYFRSSDSLGRSSLCALCIQIDDHFSAIGCAKLLNGQLRYAPSYLNNLVRRRTRLAATSRRCAPECKSSRIVLRKADERRPEPSADRLERTTNFDSQSRW